MLTSPPGRGCPPYISYNDGQLRYERNGDSYEIYYNYDADGRPTRAYKKDLVTGINYSYYLITNTRGDVIETRDGNGNVNAKFVYDSWGKLVSVTDGEGNALGANKLGSLNSIRYRGYVYDSETGLYYLQSRYYDPEVGRFLNADAVDFIGYSGEVLSYNIFAYCENNAIMYADRLGMLGLGAIATAIGLTAADLVVAALLIMVIADLATGGRVILGFSEALGLLVDSVIGGISSAFTSDNTKSNTTTKNPPHNTVYIYRHNGTNIGNLKPSDNDAAKNSGLSFSTVPEINSFRTTIEAINSTGVLFAVRDGVTHVSVYPIGGTIKEWRDAGKTSIWTQALYSVCTKVK